VKSKNADGETVYRTEKAPKADAKDAAEPMACPTQEQVEAEIAGLPELRLEELRERWKVLYGNPAPRSLRRDLLMRAVAYQIQVKAFEGLLAATKRKLREIAAAARQGRFGGEGHPLPLALAHRQDHHRHKLERWTFYPGCSARNAPAGSTHWCGRSLN